MRVGRLRRLAAAAGVAAAVAGCGFGPGEATNGEATLTVTRDYGAERLVEATVEDPTESETVLRFLDREADITTRYGGGFVQSIEGLAGGSAAGRSFDWFFYVDGVESPVGSAEREVRAGQRIWWDYRDWTAAMRVPAVVGSWPEPLAPEATLECVAHASTCDRVAARLAQAGVEPGDDGNGLPRVLVGPWQAIRHDPAAAQLSDGPARSGVFARFDRGTDGYLLSTLDVRGDEVGVGGEAAGLVAAVRDGEDPPTWLVTGTDARGVDAAAGLLSKEQLEDHYAVVVARSDVVSVPVIE